MQLQAEEAAEGGKMIERVYVYWESEGIELYKASIGKESDFTADESIENSDTTGVIWYGSSKIILERETRVKTRRDVLYVLTQYDEGHTAGEIIDFCASLDRNIWTRPLREIQILVYGSIPWGMGYYRHKAWMILAEEAIGWKLPPVPKGMKYKPLSKLM